MSVPEVERVDKKKSANEHDVGGIDRDEKMR